MFIVNYRKHAARRLVLMPLKLAHKIRDIIGSIANDPHQHHPNVSRLRDSKIVSGLVPEIGELSMPWIKSETCFW